MAETNTLSILENIKKKIQKFDEPRKAENKNFSDLGDEFQYDGPVKKTNPVEAQANVEEAVKPVDDSIEKEIETSFAKADSAEAQAEEAQEATTEEAATEEASPAESTTEAPTEHEEEFEPIEDEIDFNFDDLDDEDEEELELPEVAEEPAAEASTEEVADFESTEEVAAEPEFAADEEEPAVTEAVEEMPEEASAEEAEEEFVEPVEEDENLAEEDEEPAEADEELADEEPAVEKMEVAEEYEEPTIDEIDNEEIDLDEQEALEPEPEPEEPTPAAPARKISDEEAELDRLLHEEQLSQEAKAQKASQSPEFCNVDEFLNRKAQEEMLKQPEIMPEKNTLDLNMQDANMMRKDAQIVSAADSIVNQTTATNVSDSIKKLVDAKNVVSGVTSFSKSEAFADIAAQLMEPRLEKWLNEHLPALVEQIVREEIKKIIPKE